MRKSICQKDMALIDSPSTALDAELRDLLQDVLGLSQDQAQALQDDSGLFGELPEFDSMAVPNVLTEMEDRMHIRIDDDEVDGEIFATFGNLLQFIAAKRAA